MQTVPFPAVTVCAPNSGKWQALNKALTHFDSDGDIFEVIRTMNKDTTFFSNAFLFDYAGPIIWKILMQQIFPPLELNHELPMRLNLLPIEKQIFYLLNFACYVASYECGKKVVNVFSPIALQSILTKGFLFLKTSVVANPTTVILL